MRLTHFWSLFSDHVADQPALVQSTGSVSFRDLFYAYRSLSVQLRSEGIHSKSVALFAPNSPEWVIAFFAILKCDNRCYLIPYPSSKEQLNKTLSSIEADWIITSASIEKEVLAALQEQACNTKVRGVNYLQTRGDSKSQEAALEGMWPNPTLKECLFFQDRSHASSNRWWGYSDQQLVFLVNSLSQSELYNTNDAIHCSETWSDSFYFTHGFLLPLLCGNKISCPEALPPAPIRFLQPIHHIKNQSTHSLASTTGSILLEFNNSYDPTHFATVEENTPCFYVFQKPELIGSFAYQRIQKKQPILNIWKPAPFTSTEIREIGSSELTSRKKYFGNLVVFSPLIGTSYIGKNKLVPENTLSDSTKKTGVVLDEIFTKNPNTGDLNWIGNQSEIIIHNAEPVRIDRTETVLKSQEGICDAVCFVTKSARSQPILISLLVKKNNSLITEKDVFEHCDSLLPLNFRPQVILFCESIPLDFKGTVSRTELSKEFNSIML